MLAADASVLSKWKLELMYKAYRFFGWAVIAKSLWVPAFLELSVPTNIVRYKSKDDTSNWTDNL